MASSRPAGRLFLAAPMSEEVRRALARHLEESLAGRRLPGRMVATANWHVTLRFLGDTTVDARDRVIEALSGAELGPSFVLRFGGLGAFPRPDRARVLWLGITAGKDELAALARHAEAAAVAGGFEPEGRPFSAHLTLSRLRPEEDVSGLIAAVPRFVTPATIREIVLYSSHLGPGGSRYEAVRRFGLSVGGAPSTAEKE